MSARGLRITMIALGAIGLAVGRIERNPHDAPHVPGDLALFAR
jgi:hypothetical protein